jgi:phosphoenolpyruvate-protein phosphotransferase
MDSGLDGLGPDTIRPNQSAAEIERLLHAVEAADRELEAIVAKVESQVGAEEAAIFRAQRLMLRDPSLIKKVKTRIAEHAASAAAALQSVLTEYAAIFARIQDDYLKHRMADVRDCITRIQSHLVSEASVPAFNEKEPVVLVADEVLPSQAASFGHLNIVGIVTEVGSVTSHAAILARARGIPAVSGLRGILADVRSGDTLIIDGRDGHVVVNPGAEVLAAYRKLQREFVHLKHHLIANRDQPALSADGVPVELLANINNVEDAKLATHVGAAGVGLFRTEYLFLTHPGIPDENEQYHIYRSVIEATPQRRVTIRTLDLGGDKTVPYLGHHAETNPFLGWRSLRLSFEHPEFFQTQIRAILRAARYGKTRILFPMVTTLDELQRVNRMVRRCRQQLKARGAAFSEHIELGLMIEVPAAAICIETLAEEADFVSIGSNDLVQYLTAADRDNPKVAHLCDPLSPAVVRVLRRVIATCNERGKSVTLCGEMAGQPRSFLLLLGMGLRQFSMSPALIPTIKELLRVTSVSEATDFVAHVQRMRTGKHIRAYLTRQLRRLCPSLDILETGR